MMQQPQGMPSQPMAPPPQVAQYYHQPAYSYPQPPQQHQPQQWMMPPQPQMQVQPSPPQPQMWGQQPPPQQQQAYPQALQPQQYQQSAPQASVSDEVRTLWIGDLQYWMDETYIFNAFSATNEVVNVKVIRNKQTQMSEGYGFIEFVSHASAERVLQAYNNTLMPRVEQNFKLNWALYGGGERRPDDTPEYTIFVGDLSPDITDYVLQETFKAGYPSVKGAKVVMDRLTSRSKGYGFVRFSDENEQKRAMTEMNGFTLANRPMRTGPAASKKTSGATASYQNTQGTQGDSDPNNTTIFVGNLDSSVKEEHLTQFFRPYGELVHVKIPAGRRCGFVQFANRSCAEDALRNLNGTQLGGQNIRLSWGRSPSNKQDAPAGLVQTHPDSNQYPGYYGYPQSYESYGYASGAQDPNMYYQAYQGYGNYAAPQPQQQVPQQ